VASGLANPYFSLYVLALGGSYFEVGLTSAIGNFFMILPLILAGSLTDIIGRKKIVVYLGFLLSCLHNLLASAKLGIPPSRSILEQPHFRLQKPCLLVPGRRFYGA
jgi:MFS family permease